MTRRTGRVLVAPDKFKGSLTADEAARHIAAGLRASGVSLDIVQCPVADGGDGTMAAALAAGYRRVPVIAHGPTGALVHTAYAAHNGTAVVELADTCGLTRLPGGTPAPLNAATDGLGDVLGAALDDECQRIVLALGGSASTDGGSGLLRALGARLLDIHGRDLPPGGAALQDLHTLDLSNLHPRLSETEIIVASDVTNPLCGPHGAAAVYGAQKGATTSQIDLLDDALAHWATIVTHHGGHDSAECPGSGAAGGTGFAAMAILGAQLRSGIGVVLDLVGFDEHLAGAALAITGEGSLDAQTLHGKAPLGITAAAKTHGVPVIAIAGRNLLPREALTNAGFSAAYALTDLEPNTERSRANARCLLESSAARVAADWCR